MDINMTLIGQTIAMIVFVWFCMKFIWPPLLEAIEERQQKIAEGLAAADKGRSRLRRRQLKPRHCSRSAQAGDRHSRPGACPGKRDCCRWQGRRRKERERQLTAAKAEIEQEANRAREELRGQVSAIALASAEKILRREIDGKQHEDILGKLAQEL